MLRPTAAPAAWRDDSAKLTTISWGGIRFLWVDNYNSLDHHRVTPDNRAASLIPLNS
jgi:hypothetical protein